MIDQKLFSLEEMRAANGGSFSDVDYIHYVLTESRIGIDLVGALVRFLRPEFERIEQKFLVKATGAPERYRAYRREGKSPSEAQYWANLTEISTLFGDINAVQKGKLADTISQLWQAALMDKCRDFSQRAHKIEDEFEGEVFVTISTLSR